MRHSFMCAVCVLAIAAAITLASTPATAREVQLAGIRLGDHAIHLLDIYGQPTGIALGAGEELSAAQAPAGMGAGVDMFATPGGMGMGPMDALMGPGMGLGMPGMPAMGGMPGADIAGAPMEAVGPGAFPGGEMAGAPGAAAGAGAAGAISAQPFPMWALPVWVTLRAHEVEWIYQQGPIVLGFVLDRDGFVRVIAVAAEKCDYARTALWAPHRYVKLGDSYKRVLYRYGWPDDQIGFSWSSPGGASVGGGLVSVSFNQTSRTYTRDMMLRYEEENNIAFTLHDMVVTRIHIWE